MTIYGMDTTQSSNLSVRDSLGCAAGHLSDNEEIAGSDIRLYHKTRSDQNIGQVRTPAAARGHLIGISLSDGHRRNVIRSKSSREHLYNKGSFYLRNFDDDYNADINPFNFLLIEYPVNALKQVASEHGMGLVTEIDPISSIVDPALHHIGLAMMQCFSDQKCVSRLLIDQLAIAVQIHLVGRYVCRFGDDANRRRLLSRRQEVMSKEMLASDLGGNTPIGSIAEACGLSPSYFIRAFRGTVGVTPHKWLTVLRVDRARELLGRSQKPIAEIAIECGFADQSHLTRVFTKTTGSAPGAWRRQLKPRSHSDLSRS